MSFQSTLSISFRGYGRAVIERFRIGGCCLAERDAIRDDFLRLLRARGLDITKVDEMKDEDF